jgi:hypothetical protein
MLNELIAPLNIIVLIFIFGVSGATIAFITAAVIGEFKKD